MHEEVPDFQSDIPAHLLTNASPQDKYIMENISILGQKSNWLTETQRKQSESLAELKLETSEIKIQTTKTNGSVAKLKEQAKEAEEVVKFYKRTIKLADNKIFMLFGILTIIAFFTYIAPWLAVNGKVILPAIVKWFFGA